MKRLDGILVRNRKNLVLDIAIAAVFPLALLLSGMALGSALPKLSSAAPAAAVATATATDANAPS